MYPFKVNDYISKIDEEEVRRQRLSDSLEQEFEKMKIAEGYKENKENQLEVGSVKSEGPVTRSKSAQPTIKVSLVFFDVLKYNTFWIKPVKFQKRNLILHWNKTL